MAMPQPMKPGAPLAFPVAVAGIAVFSAMDGVMKGLTLAAGVYDAMLWRTVALFALSAPIYLWRRRGWPSREALKLHAVRGIVSTVMALTFFWGLARIPMAQAIALCYIAPVIALFLAAMLLGERIGRATIAAAAIATLGVGVIVMGQQQAHQGEEALIGTAVTLFSALCYSWNIVLMRQQALVAGPEEITFFQSVTVGICLAVAAPWLAHAPPSAQFGPILLAALLASVSLALLSWAYARGEASYLAFTEYTSFVWSMLFGWLLFAEVPTLYTLAGAALIISACIFAARRRPAPDVPDLEAALP